MTVSDFTRADWPAVPTQMHRPLCQPVAQFQRSDGYRIEFYVDDGRRMVECVHVSRPLASAEIRVRERDGEAILVPPPYGKIEEERSVRFWPSRPSIHCAALGFAEELDWPKESQ